MTTRRPGGAQQTPGRTASPRAGTATSARAPRISATRPATAARGRRPSEELRTPRTIKGLAILVTIFVMLAITLIPAVRAMFSQQGQINALHERIAQQRESVATLQKEQQQWMDPAYVEQQARARLKFVRVGERSYTVIDGDAPPVLTGGTQIASPVQTSAAKGPWYGQLWQSMVIADISGNRADSRTSAVPSTP